MRTFLILLCCALGITAHAQQPAFPSAFIGHWKGKLQWMAAGRPATEFTMQLKVKPTDVAGQYTWHLQYGDSVVPVSSENNRPYILKPVDTAQGHWLIDERDGIILDGYVHGNSFHGAFTVNANTIVNNFIIENGKLMVEFFTIKLAEKNTSGKGTSDVPFVDSYRIAGYQKGVLSKVD
jgi:hypothetical protein